MELMQKKPEAGNTNGCEKPKKWMMILQVVPIWKKDTKAESNEPEGELDQFIKRNGRNKKANYSQRANTV
jgi:hypothetical protein